MSQRCLYFAYGLNLDRRSMARRCPGAFFAGRATLPDHQFRITTRGVATVVPQRGSRVSGVIWWLRDHHLEALDLYEGVDLGLYGRKTRCVVCQGKATWAWMYQATETDRGAARPGYLEAVIEAALAAGLEGTYVKELEGWLGRM